MDETMDNLIQMIAGVSSHSRGRDAFFSLFGLGLIANRVAWLAPHAFEDQALWNRGRVSTCSNEIDKFHAIANAGTSELRNSMPKLAEPIDTIFASLDSSETIST
jgi:hypothetical protein